MHTQTHTQTLANAYTTKALNTTKTSNSITITRTHLHSTHYTQQTPLPH